jgi:hypothetical protein
MFRRVLLLLALAVSVLPAPARAQFPGSPPALITRTTDLSYNNCNWFMYAVAEPTDPGPPDAVAHTVGTVFMMNKGVIKKMDKLLASGNINFICEVEFHPGGIFGSEGGHHANVRNHCSTGTTQGVFVPVHKVKNCQ